MTGEYVAKNYYKHIYLKKNSCEIKDEFRIVKFNDYENRKYEEVFWRRKIEFVLVFLFYPICLIFFPIYYLYCVIFTHDFSIKIFLME